MQWSENQIRSRATWCSGALLILILHILFVLAVVAQCMWASILLGWFVVEGVVQHIFTCHSGDSVSSFVAGVEEGQSSSTRFDFSDDGAALSAYTSLPLRPLRFSTDSQGTAANEDASVHRSSGEGLNGFDHCTSTVREASASAHAPRICGATPLGQPPRDVLIHWMRRLRPLCITFSITVFALTLLTSTVVWTLIRISRGIALQLSSTSLRHAALASCFGIQVKEADGRFEASVSQFIFVSLLQALGILLMVAWMFVCRLARSYRASCGTQAHLSFASHLQVQRVELGWWVPCVVQICYSIAACLLPSFDLLGVWVIGCGAVVLMRRNHWDLAAFLSAVVGGILWMSLLLQTPLLHLALGERLCGKEEDNSALHYATRVSLCFYTEDWWKEWRTSAELHTLRFVQLLFFMYAAVLLRCLLRQRTSLHHNSTVTPADLSDVAHPPYIVMASSCWMVYWNCTKRHLQKRSAWVLQLLVLPSVLFLPGLYTTVLFSATQLMTLVPAIASWMRYCVSAVALLLLATISLQYIGTHIAALQIPLLTYRIDCATGKWSGVLLFEVALSRVFHWAGSLRFHTTARSNAATNAPRAAVKVRHIKAVWVRYRTQRAILEYLVDLFQCFPLEVYVRNALPARVALRVLWQKMCGGADVFCDDFWALHAGEDILISGAESVSGAALVQLLLLTDHIPEDAGSTPAMHDRKECRSTNDAAVSHHGGQETEPGPPLMPSDEGVPLSLLRLLNAGSPGNGRLAWIDFLVVFDALLNLSKKCATVQEVEEPQESQTAAIGLITGLQSRYCISFTAKTEGVPKQVRNWKGNIQHAIFKGLIGVEMTGIILFGSPFPWVCVLQMVLCVVCTIVSNHFHLLDIPYIGFYFCILHQLLQRSPSSTLLDTSRSNCFQQWQKRCSFYAGVHVIFLVVWKTVQESSSGNFVGLKQSKWGQMMGLTASYDASDVVLRIFLVSLVRGASLQHIPTQYEEHTSVDADSGSSRLRCLCEIQCRWVHYAMHREIQLLLDSFCIAVLSFVAITWIGRASSLDMFHICFVILYAVHLLMGFASIRCAIRSLITLLVYCCTVVCWLSITRFPPSQCAILIALSSIADKDRGQESVSGGASAYCAKYYGGNSNHNITSESLKRSQQLGITPLSSLSSGTVIAGWKLLPWFIVLSFGYARLRLLTLRNTKIERTSKTAEVLQPLLSSWLTKSVALLQEFSHPFSYDVLQTLSAGLRWALWAVTIYQFVSFSTLLDSFFGLWFICSVWLVHPIWITCLGILRVVSLQVSVLFFVPVSAIPENLRRYIGLPENGNGSRNALALVPSLLCCIFGMFSCLLLHGENCVADVKPREVGTDPRCSHDEDRDTVIMQRSCRSFHSQSIHGLRDPNGLPIAVKMLRVLLIDAPSLDAMHLCLICTGAIFSQGTIFLWLLPLNLCAFLWLRTRMVVDRGCFSFSVAECVLRCELAILCFLRLGLPPSWYPSYPILHQSAMRQLECTTWGRYLGCNLPCSTIVTLFLLCCCMRHRGMAVNIDDFRCPEVSGVLRQKGLPQRLGVAAWIRQHCMSCASLLSTKAEPYDSVLCSDLRAAYGRAGMQYSLPLPKQCFAVFVKMRLSLPVGLLAGVGQRSIPGVVQIVAVLLIVACRSSRTWRWAIIWPLYISLLLALLLFTDLHSLPVLEVVTSPWVRLAIGHHATRFTTTALQSLALYLALLEYRCFDAPQFTTYIIEEIQRHFAAAQHRLAYRDAVEQKELLERLHALQEQQEAHRKLQDLREAHGVVSLSPARKSPLRSEAHEPFGGSRSRCYCSATATITQRRRSPMADPVQAMTHSPSRLRSARSSLGETPNAADEPLFHPSTLRPTNLPLPIVARRSRSTPSSFLSEFRSRACTPYNSISYRPLTGTEEASRAMNSMAFTSSTQASNRSSADNTLRSDLASFQTTSHSFPVGEWGREEVSLPLSSIGKDKASSALHAIDTGEVSSTRYIRAPFSLHAMKSRLSCLWRWRQTLALYLIRHNVSVGSSGILAGGCEKVKEEENKAELVPHVWRYVAQHWNWICAFAALLHFTVSGTVSNMVLSVTMLLYVLVQHDAASRKLWWMISFFSAALLMVKCSTHVCFLAFGDTGQITLELMSLINMFVLRVSLDNSSMSHAAMWVDIVGSASVFWCVAFLWFLAYPDISLLCSSCSKSSDKSEANNGGTQECADVHSVAPNPQWNSMAQHSTTRDSPLSRPASCTKRLSLLLHRWRRHRRGAGSDFYAAQFCFDGAALLVFCWVYYLIAPLETQVDDNIVTSLQRNKLPGAFVVAALLLVVLLFLERIIYVLQSLVAKLALHTLLVVVYHCLYVLWLHSMHTSIVPVAVLVSIKMASAWCSALQLQHGYSLHRQHDPFTTRADLLHWFGYTLFRVIPFLLELRVLIDWSFSTTALKLQHWILLEDIHHNLYIRFVDMHDLYGTSRFQGRRFPYFVRCYQGVLGFTFILGIVFFPLFWYSTLSQKALRNVVTEWQSSIRIDGATEPLYYSDGSLETRSDYENITSALSGTEVEMRHKGFGPNVSVQVVQHNPYSSSLWVLSPRTLELLQRGANDGSLKLRISSRITRAFANEEQSITVALEQVYFLPDTSIKLLNDGIKALQTCNGTASGGATLHVPLPSFYSPLTLSKSLVVEEVPYSRKLSCKIEVVSMMQDCALTHLWCEGIETSTDSAMQHSLVYVVSSLDVAINQGSIFFIPDIGIVALYTTFVLAISRYVRNLFTGDAHRVSLLQLANPRPIADLLQHIYMTRSPASSSQYGDLLLEQQLFLELLDLLRPNGPLMDAGGRRALDYQNGKYREDLHKSAQQPFR